MKLMKIALVTGVLTLSVTALALAAGKPETVPPTPNSHSGGGPEYAPVPTPGPKEGLPDQAKAYGRICKEESKQREEGDTDPGTPFSRCVKNMAQAAHHQHMAPGRVCKGESKKHEKGAKGQESDFRKCVHHVIELRRHEHEEEKNS